MRCQPLIGPTQKLLFIKLLSLLTLLKPLYQCPLGVLLGTLVGFLLKTVQHIFGSARQCSDWHLTLQMWTPYGTIPYHIYSLKTQGTYTCPKFTMCAPILAYFIQLISHICLYLQEYTIYMPIKLILSTELLPNWAQQFS